MNDLRTAAQQALEALEAFLSEDLSPYAAAKTIAALHVALEELAQEQADDWTRCHHCGQTMPPVPLGQEQAEPDLSRCPQCNGPADNGHDRSIPPSPYLCTKCMAEPAQEQAKPVQEPDWRDLYLKEKQRADMWRDKYESVAGDEERIHLQAEPVQKSLPCPTPKTCRQHCCGGWCGPRAVPVQAKGGGNLPPPLQAEPVQEPVAWRWGYRSVTTGEMDWRGYVEIAAHPNLRSPEIIIEPLYTAPPQREPLTEKEMYAVEEEARKNFRLSQKGPRGQQITYWDGLTPWLIRAVEKAVWEKNK